MSLGPKSFRRAVVRAAVALAVVVAGLAAAPPVQADLTAGPSAGYVVTLQPGESVQVESSQRDIETERVYSHALRGFTARLTRGQVADLRRDPDVLAVEADVRVWASAQSVPTGLDRITAPDNPGLAPSSTTVDGVDDRVDVDIAVIDSGTGPHPDLNVVSRTNCAMQTSCTDGAGVDDNGHGTHVGGIAAALDNGFGVVGAAPGARLWSVKVLDAFGAGTLGGLVAGIDWVTARADIIDVANMSIQCNCQSTAIDTALARAKNAGVTVVVAAGNSSRDAGPFSISNSPNVISTSALADFDGVAGGLGAATCWADIDDTLAEYSNFGAVIDMVAPGSCIRSTYLSAGYAVLSGTSMASPQVAGAAALLASTPAYAGNPTAIRSRLVADSNQNWIDDSGDGIVEPLLDVSDLVPVMVPAAPGLTLSVDNAWVAEGATGQVTVRASRPLVGGEVIRATLATKNSSATSGKDYTAVSTASVRLTASQPVATVPVPTLTDIARESNETVTLTLSKVLGATVADGSGTMTIYDTSGQLSLSVGDVTATEGSSPQVEVRLSGPVPVGSQVTAKLTVAGVTATSGADFAPVPTQTLTFAAGVQTLFVPLSFLADSAHELDETFSLKLSSASGARVADAGGVATIVDAQGPIHASVGDAWAAEGTSGASPLPFVVTLSDAPVAGQVVTVTVKSANSTAKAGTDYVALPSTQVTFAAGETAKTVSVSMLGDTGVEGNETVKLSASAVGAVLSDAAAIGTIVNDDGVTPAPAPRRLAIGDAYLTESGSGGTGVVQLSLSTPPGSGETVTAKVATSDGTAVGGSDYQPVPLTTVVFGAGQSNATVPVAALTDVVPEGQESFSLVVSSVVGAVATDTVGTVRVVSDDTAIRARLDDVTVAEGSGGQSPATVTVQLSRAPVAGQTVSVMVATAAGTATAGSDFVSVPATQVVFGPGVTSQTVPLAVLGDTLHEGHETFTLALTSPVGLTLEDTAAVVTVVDEEGPVEASLSDVEAVEGSSGTSAAAMMLRLSSPADAGQTFTLLVATTTGGTATAGTDYVSLATTTVTITAGQSSAVVPVSVKGDLSVEPDETVLVTATTPTGSLVLADASGVLTIKGDD